MPEDTPILVLTTVNTVDSGTMLANKLVEQRLAACVSTLPPMQSTYRWQGELCTETEQLLLIKSTRAVQAHLLSELERLHPYETPEILVLNPAEVSPAYARWLAESITP